MPRSGSLQLARVFGIRIGVDFSWFLVLFLFIFIVSGSFRATLGGSDGQAYLTAVASVLLFFASILLHELGHALVARRQGIGVASIDLWMLGGIATMSRATNTPGEELKVAAAGPLVTLVIAIGCLAAGLGFEGSERFFHAMVLSTAVPVTPAALLLSWLALMNGALFLFNLVPAFPLDGGRIALAIAWRLSGDRLRATRIAARMGQGFSYLLIGLGIFLALRGGFGNGIWFIVVGFFLGQAARVEIARAGFSERLGRVSVADIMDPEPVAIPEALPAEYALDEFFLRYRWPWFPVVDDHGRFTGVLRREAVDRAVATGDREEAAGRLVEPEGTTLRIGEHEPLEALLASEPLRRLGALMAVDADGVLRGVVTLEQVRRALEVSARPGGA